MDSIYASNCEVLRTRFEGREAIYVEKGALRVRVNNIRQVEGTIGADVEEIITPGLGVGLFHRVHPPSTGPFRWKIIGAGDSTTFSAQSWEMGYGGWKLYFAPGIVQVVIDFAARRSNNADPVEGYRELCRLLKDLPLNGRI
jgi:hypothetical protein